MHIDHLMVLYQANATIAAAILGALVAVLLSGRWKG